MKTVMTIIQNPARAEMYERLARISGAEILHSEGALHALTQLERTRPDVIICDAVMNDMTGEEFRMVVTEELKGQPLPVFLLADAEAFQGNVNLSAQALCGPEVLRQVLQVAGISPKGFALPLPTDARPQLQGDLNQFALPDLLNWVSEMRFQGHWLVTVHDAEGHERTAHLLMYDGNVIYAEYAGLVGKGAIFALLRAINEHKHTSFKFYKTEDMPAIQAEDLQQKTSRLLMELAVDIDHLSAHAHN